MQSSVLVKTTRRLSLAGVGTELAQALSDAGYQIVASQEPAWDLFSQVDAILLSAFEWPNYIHLTKVPAYQRPLLILVTDNPEESASGVDFMTSTHPQWVIRTIENSLKSREQSLKLAAESDERLKQVQNSEAQRAEQMRIVREAEVLMNALVRNVSHELRTPLLQVKSAVSMLAEEVHQMENNEELEKLITFAENATARLELHVRNITMLGGSLVASLAPTILREAVEQAIRSLRRNWQFRDEIDRIHIRIHPDVPPVMADRQGLSTVLELLLDNALKFSKDTVEILATPEAENRVRIEVCDQGIGISHDQIDAIFKPFYQANSETNRPFGGCGVGLTLVKMILERHDEKLTVFSEPGKGSRFIFQLNVANLDTYFE